MSSKTALLGVVALIAAGAVFAVAGYRNATAPPIVRQLVLTAPDYPRRAPPVRIVLFSDVHVHGPDMPPARVATIVKQINALKPDIIVAAGDFVGNNWVGRSYSAAEAIAPLAGLRARYGAFAVLGNNDYGGDGSAVRQALKTAGVHLLEDQAAQVGPLSLGGLDGRIHHGPDWNRFRKITYTAIERTPGFRVMAAHRPDEFAISPPSIHLVLAGHTHCGQIVLPIVGALQTGSDYGSKYLCGVIRDGSRLLVVTAGLGTSHVPLRFGAPPDIWLISIHGAAVGGA